MQEFLLVQRQSKNTQALLEIIYNSNVFKVSVSFTNSINDFKLVELKNRETPIQQGIRIDQNAREIVYSNFSNTSPEVFYWVLPSPFLGDKVISYGGYLRYTVRYTPAPGGQSSRNVAPDVELVSVSFLFYC